uniref:Uncharacterized protein n=1 Tax=Arundo donax TaxID=35708 RepID=A0A0A8ZQ68_ARUDO
MDAQVVEGLSSEN